MKKPKKTSMSREEQDKLNQALQKAAWGGFIMEAEGLITKGANVDTVDSEYRTPLHYAAIFGEIKMTRILLKHGANPCLTARDGTRPIDLAWSEQLREILQNHSS